MGKQTRNSKVDEDVIYQSQFLKGSSNNWAIDLTQTRERRAQTGIGVFF